MYKSATTGDCQIFEKTFKPSESDIEETITEDETNNYDDGADDEQTVVTFRTGRGGRSRKPELVSETDSNSVRNAGDNKPTQPKSTSKPTTSAFWIKAQQSNY